MASSRIRVHPTHGAAAEVFRDVMLRCWTGAVASNSSAYRESIEDIAAQLERGYGVLMLADGKPVGCGRFLPVPGPCGDRREWIEIKRVGVVREYRKCGLGPAIVAALEAEAVRRGYPGAQLGVRADQLRLIAFWEGLGYAPANDVVLSNPNPLAPTPFFMRKLF